jgi:phosphoenolpyruvate carboxylase
MEKVGGKLPDDKDADAVKKYFQKAYPDMDFDRVYASDMKKMVKWFEVLKKNNVEIKLPEATETEEPANIATETETVAEETPKKKKTTTRKKKAE